MAREDHIIGLDIGSTAVRMVVGQRLAGERAGLHIIGAVESATEGIAKGIITSLEDAVSSVSGCLEQAERMTGLPIRHVWVGVSGVHILSQESRGVVGVSRSDGEIRNEDVGRAVEAARTVATPPNYEILHVLPRAFTVDGQAGIKDPVGMTGIRLEVDAEIIQALSSQIKNLTKCVFRTGLEIEDLVYSPLATALAVATPRQKELGVATVNLGGATTSLAVFEEGDLLHTAVLPLGSQHITSDLAIGLRTSIEVAERLKIEYGIARPWSVSKGETIDLASLGAPASELVTRKYMAEIIEARVEEIFEKIERELKRIGRDGMLPAGLLFTGGGARLPELVELAKKKLRLPAALGEPIGVQTVTEAALDVAFSTAVGLVLWGAEVRGRVEKPAWGRLSGELAGVGKAAGGLKKWFRSILP
ncbi:cell division protein FtsA [Candidatus Uhrbacteria bacterium]|nr:cell division protein FtsA [Candidatus Uhrbacteria bacterium]